MLGQGWGDPYRLLLSGRPACPPHSPSLSTRASSQASCLDCCSTPLIGLHLSVSLSHQHAATTAARLIFLIHCSAHPFPRPRSPSGSVVGRDKSSPGGGTESRPSRLGPAGLAGVSPMDPSHPLTWENHWILGLCAFLAPHLCSCSPPPGMPSAGFFSLMLSPAGFELLGFSRCLPQHGAWCNLAGVLSCHV